LKKFTKDSLELREEIKSVLRNELKDEGNSKLAFELNKVKSYDYNFNILNCLLEGTVIV